jgi:ParB family chromosome partitioning protein
MSANKKAKKPHLGRGLESLLGSMKSAPVDVEGPVSSGEHFPPDPLLKKSLLNISIDSIIPNPYQPRTTWNNEELSDLAESIKVNGLLQPIVARPAGTGYEVIAGERRLRAAQQAGLSEISVMVRDASDDEMLALALVENIHRSDLNPIERARAYKKFVESFGLTQSEAAERLGQDRSVIANYLRLLELPSEVQEMLAEGSLSAGHGRAILGLPTDSLRQKLANRAMAGRLSVREVERIVRKHVDGTKTDKPEKTKEPYLLDLERKLEELLGTKVRIQSRKKANRGRIIIDYYSLDDFERVTEKMGLGGSEDL